MLATHLALSRQVNTREHGMPEHNKKRTRSSFASAQYVEVFLPILAVCKHVLKTASMKEVSPSPWTAAVCESMLKSMGTIFACDTVCDAVYRKQPGI